MMTKKEFLEQGTSMLHWIAEYLEQGNKDGAVFPSHKPGDFLSRLPENPPLHPEPAGSLFHDFLTDIYPGLTHWNDRRFFGYFPCNNSYASVLGEFLSAGVGVNTFSWLTSPSATELEIRVMEWLGQMLELPWRGCLQDTASTGVFSALLAARESIGNTNANGLNQHAKALTIYITSEAHSSCVKAVRMSGIGEKFIRYINTDENDAMDPEHLRAQIRSDKTIGFEPCFVMATLGTTSNTAIDPVQEIARVCQEEGVWLHVDAALAGTAAVLPEMKWMMKGVSEADSFLFNPHKWMFTNFDCCAFFCKDSKKLTHALSIEPEYLRGKDDNVTNFRDWGPQLGRRFRSLKLWFVIKSYGVDGLQDKIRMHLRMAQNFANRIETHQSLVLFCKPKLNTVCFHLDDNAATERLHKAINEKGMVFVTHSKIRGIYLIRASFGQTNAQESDESLLFEHIKTCLSQIEPYEGK